MAVDLVWGQVAEGTLTDIAIWDDPNNDGDPSDAVLLTTAGPVPAANPGAWIFTTVPVPPTFVGNAGDSFFIGAHLTQQPDEYPLALDETPPFLMQSWIAVGDNLEDLSANSYIELIDSFGYPGNWLIRGHRVSIPDCNNNGVLDECDIADGFSRDDNNNGIPDECEIPGDLDGDGSVGVKDLLILLGSWGSCDDCNDCIADLDGDCTVGVGDLLILLGNWG